MYGKIHVCIKSLVLSKFDEETWNKILKESNFDETTDFLMFQSYSDEKTVQLVTAACKITGLPPETVLEVFGQCWLEFCMENGYDEMIRTLGGDFTSFVQNLDALHAHLSRTYTKLLYPSFRCETNNDGTLTLHYYSKRTGFYYIVVGVIPSIAKILYNQKASITVDKVIKQDKEKGIMDEHVIFTVTLSEEEGEENKKSRELKLIKPTVPKNTLIQGQMRWMPDINHMIFISSPCISSLEELVAMNLYISDIPLYDVTRELILLNQQRMAEMEIAKRLDETTAALTKMSKALEIEKKKTDDLLHEMLPSKVASELLAGRTVDAEKFECVTILFSDVVTFTNIAAACTPMDIVNLLNNMYQRFDHLTIVHNVYKVETIGDAYMAVSGVPTRTDNHAEDVANFSLDMVVEAGKVQSPATGKPIQIRVGFHSGSVVAGVVGQKMPRYCLFGDTVNTASRMESHGVPGRVHASPQAANLLFGKGYTFRDRGKIKVKGKGMMNTYLLINRSGKDYTEPDDDFRNLPIAESVDLSIEVEVLPDQSKKKPSPESVPPNTEGNEEIKPTEASMNKDIKPKEISSNKPRSQSFTETPIPVGKKPPPLQKYNSTTCSLS